MRLYGASPADFFSDPASGAPKPGAKGDVYDAPAAGVRITDLRGPDGVTAQTQAVADDDGMFRFYAPDDSPTSLWIEVGAESRYVVHAADLGDRVDASTAALATLTAVPDAVSQSELTDAVADAVGAEADLRSAALTAHNDDESAHPNKVTAMNGPVRQWRAGNVPGVGAVPMPTAADGLEIGDMIYLVG